MCKVVPCNWKLALEAFVESFHIPVAHPQTTSYVAWDTSQYDIFPGVRHVNRMLTVEGMPSPSEGDVPAENHQQHAAGRGLPRKGQHHARRSG